MSEIQSKLKALHTELEKTHRGEDRYLTLVTEVRRYIHLLFDCPELELGMRLILGASNIERGERPADLVPSSGTRGAGVFFPALQCRAELS